MTIPSDDEGLHMVRDDKPRPRLFQENIPVTELPVAAAPPIEEQRSVRVKRVAVVVGIVLVLAILAGGLAYWIERHRYPVIVAIDVPDKNPSADSVAAGPARLVPVKPDMLEVTAISLGDPRLAIVNGRELTEGESIALKTTLGRASLRVTSIQDGLVRFRHGGQTIDVPLQAARKTPR